MKLTLETPVWYSTDNFYVANVSDTDGMIKSAPVDITYLKKSIEPTSTARDAFLAEAIPILYDQIKSWFSAALTVDKLKKKLICEFKELEIASEPRWVSFIWVPKHFMVDSKTFKILFNVLRMEESSPRIPFVFLEEDVSTNTPPNVAAPPPSVAAPVPSTVTNTQSIIDEIPYSTENTEPIELQDAHRQEKHRLHHAKLRAAIARLKVEELREDYIRQYGDDSTDEEDDDDESFVESDDSKSVPKK